MSDIGYIVSLITLEDVLRAEPETIYYGAQTCWWTHDARHLGHHESGLPCDPRGGMLFQAPATEFLAAAQAHPEQYGRHGLDAFMAAHHLNCRVSASDPRPTCFTEWDYYNDLIDGKVAGWGGRWA